MQRNRDEGGSITWQDALTAWADLQKHYGCHVFVENWLVTPGPRACRLSFCLHVKRLTGAKGFKTATRRLVEYPTRNARTFPGAIVYHLSAICLELERQQREEKDALKQTPMWSDAQ